MAESHRGPDQSAPLSALPPGTRLRGYEIVSVLGEGTFGITYLANDVTLGREVAVKEYLPSLLAIRRGDASVVPRSTAFAADFAWGRERFLDEARTLAKLDGLPAIVRVIDFLEGNGTAYMVMALARGETLEQRISSAGRHSPSDIDRILLPLLDGLEGVHEAGYLHRDIKPSNIVLDNRGLPTLIDFGASRMAIANRTSVKMTAVFTPGYAAVEQFVESLKQGPWTDIYCLSATLYHAIAGSQPPSAVGRTLDDAYRPLVNVAPAGFSPELLAGIDAGMAVRPQDRPQSIVAWRKLLVRQGDDTVYLPRQQSKPTAQLLVDEPARASEADAEPRLEGTVPARRYLSWIVGASALLALLGGSWLAFVQTGAQGTADSNAGRTNEPSTTSERRTTEDNSVKLKQEVEARRQVEEDKRHRAELAAREAAEETARKERAEAELAARRRAEQEERRRIEEAERQRVALAAQKAAEEAAQKERAEAELAARRRAEQEERRRIEEAERQRVALAAQKAAEEAARKEQAEAELAARRRAEQEERRRIEEAQQRADVETRRVAEVEARRKSEAEARQRVEEEARRKAAAEAAARAAETLETALRLTPIDRQRVQVALTSLGFNTYGADRVFGPRTREMIGAWQESRNDLKTGFLSNVQFQALLKEGAAAIQKFEDEMRSVEQQRKAAEEAKKKADEDAKKAAAGERKQSTDASRKVEADERSKDTQSIACQDGSGKRVTISGSACPFGLKPVP